MAFMRSVGELDPGRVHDRLEEPQELEGIAAHVERARSARPCCSREYSRPVILDAHYGPTLLRGGLERLLGTRRVVELPLGVVVQDEQPQGGTALAAGVAEHGDVA